jgi:beta-galactosidase
VCMVRVGYTRESEARVFRDLNKTKGAGKLLLALLLLLTGGATFCSADTRPLTDAYAEPVTGSGHVKVHVEIALPYAGNAKYTLSVHVADAGGSQLVLGEKEIEVKSGRAVDFVDLFVTDHKLWSPEHPNIYRASAVLLDFRGLQVDQRDLVFGFRDFERRGNHFYLNGLPVFLRAFAGEFLASGDHGCMTSDREYIRKRILTAKQYGFNAERHHTHFPMEAYLDIADELGLMQQLEIQGRMRAGPGSPEFEATRRQWEEVVRLGRRHASVVIVSMGNEVFANDPKLVSGMDQLYDIAKEMAPGMLVLNRSGSVPGNDVVGKYDLIERPMGEYEHGGKLGGEALNAYLRGDRVGRAREFPVIAHEYPLASAYPRTEKLSLYPSPPPWLQVAAKKAEGGGYLQEMSRFARNAEAIQWRVIKQMIEEARKFPELSGYSMLRLEDTGAMVGGILDDFSNPKTVQAEEFLKVNGPTIVTADWATQTFRGGDRFEVLLSISHQGQEPLSGTISWRLVGDGGALGAGEGPVGLKGFGIYPAANASVVLPQVTRPAHLKLEARLSFGANQVSNDWDFWVFPQVRGRRETFWLYDPNHRLDGVKRIFSGARVLKTPGQLRPSKDVVVTDSWPDWIDDFLATGGRLLLISDKNWKEPEEMGNHGTHLAFFTSRAPVALPELDEPLTHWLTIPSNYPRRWGNSGTVIEPHPALGDFPHDDYCDFQFFKLIRRAKSFWLDEFPAPPPPIIRTIDNFWHGHNKSYLTEFGVGSGRVLATTLNITQSLGHAPETDYLLLQFIRYIQSSGFKPVTRFSSNELRESVKRFANQLPELIKQTGDANAPPVKYRYHPLSGDMN